MSDAIGGYFGLEARTECSCGFPHEHGAQLNTGRNAFEHILTVLPNVQRVMLPSYTCEVMKEPLLRLPVIPYCYEVNHKFEIAEDLPCDDGDYIVVNNYFGIKDAYVERMAEKYGSHLIVDCAQAFFAPELPQASMFYSARKFFGVPDGGLAVMPQDNRSWLLYDTDDSSERLEHLKIRVEQSAEKGYGIYQTNERKLNNQPMKQMSVYTRDALRHIDYEQVVARRRENFRMLHEALKDYNVLPIPDLESFACPMAYPYVDCYKRDFRQMLVDNRIFVPKYWPGMMQAKLGSNALEIADRVLPLPIDQRYGEEEMKKIIEIMME